MLATTNNLQMVESIQEDKCGLLANTTVLFKLFEHVQVLVCGSGTGSNPSTDTKGNLLWEAI